MEFAFVWALADFLNLGSLTLSNKLFWENIAYIGIVGLPVSWLLFSMEYTGKSKRITKTLIGIMTSISLIILLIVWTNQYHHLYRREIFLMDVSGVVILGKDFAPFFWISTTYFYSLIIIGTGLLIWSTSLSNYADKGQSIIFIVALLVSLMANIFHVFISPIDFTSVSFSIMGVILLIGITRYQILDIVPIAHKNVFRNMGDAVIVLGRLNQIVEINPSMEKLLGIDNKKIRGKEFNQILDIWPELNKAYMSLSSKDQAKNLNISKWDKIFEISVSNIFDYKDFLVGHITVLHDITEIKKYEKELEDIIEFLPDATLIIDRNKKITAWNKAIEEMTKVPKEEIIGKDHTYAGVPFYGYPRPHLADLLFENNPEIKSKYDFVKQEGRSLYVEVFAPALYGNKGAYIWAAASPLVDQNGRVNGAIESFRDVTEQKKSKEKIDSLNEALRVINKTLRHDILNDLTVVMTACDIMHVEDKRLEQKINKALKKSVSLIEQMRELERALVFDEDLSEKSLRSVAESVMKNYPDIKFSITGNCTILCDEAIYSVIDNIARNSVVHGKTDMIDISIRDKDVNCEMRIADYGKGILPDIKDKIFEEGESFGDTRGSGLGLYIVKKVIERYGGTIEVEDNNPSGVVFVLKFRKV
jgi:PAS domain S-box-containing protein